MILFYPFSLIQKYLLRKKKFTEYLLCQGIIPGAI